MLSSNDQRGGGGGCILIEWFRVLQILKHKTGYRFELRP
jgi:hypothetical protein